MVTNLFFGGGRDLHWTRDQVSFTQASMRMFSHASADDGQAETAWRTPLPLSKTASETASPRQKGNGLTEKRMETDVRLHQETDSTTNPDLT